LKSSAYYAVRRLDPVLRRKVFGFPGLAVGHCESVHQSRFDHVQPDALLIRRRSRRVVIWMPGTLYRCGRNAFAACRAVAVQLTPQGADSAGAVHTGAFDA
jgi:hypothetical protein